MAEERKTPARVVVPRERAGNGAKGPERLEPLTELMDTLMRSAFTGYLKINFSQGGISRVEKFEEISKKLDK